MKYPNPFIYNKLIKENPRKIPHGHFIEAQPELEKYLLNIMGNHCTYGIRYCEVYGLIQFILNELGLSRNIMFRIPNDSANQIGDMVDWHTLEMDKDGIMEIITNCLI